MASTTVGMPAADSPPQSVSWSVKEVVAAKAFLQIAGKAFHLEHSQILIDQQREIISISPFCTSGKHFAHRYITGEDTSAFSLINLITFKSGHESQIQKPSAPSSRGSAKREVFLGSQSEHPLIIFCSPSDSSSTMFPNAWDQHMAAYSTIPSKRKASAPAAPNNPAANRRLVDLPTSPHQVQQHGLPQATPSSHMVNQPTGGPQHELNLERRMIRALPGSGADALHAPSVVGPSITMSKQHLDQLLQERCQPTACRLLQGATR